MSPDEAPRWPGRRRLSTRQADGLVVLVLLGTLVADAVSRVLLPGQRHNDAVMYALFVVLAVPYLFHRTRPLLSLGVTLGAVLVYSTASYGPFPGLAAFFLLFGIALHADRRRAAIAVAATAATMAYALAVQPAGVSDRSTAVSTFAVTLVAWLAGENLRYRRARWASLEERALLLEREREERTRQAVTEERLRIARELHDVVAHAMSVIAVQSGVGNHVIDHQPEEAKRALSVIETTSRDALTEMRRMLGVLRREDDSGTVSLEPSPGLVDVARLVEQVAEGGVVVTVRTEGEVVELPSAVGLSAYRIVQEALTNVLKHGGSSAQVVLTYQPGDLAIDVIDPGGSRPSRGQHLVTPGHGLIGMRERVTLFGGALEAGPRPGGGFLVSAHLPWGSPVVGP